MSKEEDVPARVTRGALRRMSVEQEPTSAPGTPKKTIAAAATSKKLAVLDAIQEGSNGPSDAELEEDSAGRASKGGSKKDTSLVGNRSVLEKKAPSSRQRNLSLTEENVSLWDSTCELRRTPRRRPSQDQTLTPQTLPKRVTRRNSVTSDDGNLGAATPKASRTRHSIATPAVIVEDDEKEEQTNANATAEADLSDLDIRKLRNRSISNSPVPRASPSGKNTSTASLKEAESGASPVKAGSESSSPQKTDQPAASQDQEMQESESLIDMVNTPVKSDDFISVSSSTVNEQKEQQCPPKKDVHFEEGTPEQLNKSKYPKTPVAASGGGKRRKLSEKLADESLTAASEVIIVDETIKESPQVVDPAPATPKTPTKASQSPKKAPKLIVIDETIKDSPPQATQETTSPKTPTKASKMPKKEPSEEAVEQSLDESVDASIAELTEQVCEDLNQADLSVSILGTPKPIIGGKGKTHFSHLREGSSSTPIAAKQQPPLDEIPEEEQKEEKEETTPASKSWSQAVKGSGKDKGIDVFSVRKQEEEEKQEEEAKTLNESLQKRKSLEKMVSLKIDEEEEDEGDEEEDEEDEINASQKRSSFVDDEAMEVDDYESGDSMDSETRAELEDNRAEDEGESIGSQDTDVENEEEEDDDSFIASDGEEEGELLDGTGDDLHSEEEADRSSKQKKRKRIVQPLDSSEDEKETSKTESNVSEHKSPKKGDSSRRLDVSKTDSPKKIPTTAVVAESPKKEDTSKILNVSKTDSPKKTPTKTVEAKSPKKTPVMKSLDDEEAQEKSADDIDTSVAAVEESKTATPKKNALLKELSESPAKVTSSSDTVASPKSPKKTPAKPSPEAETKEATKSAEKRRASKTMELEDSSDAPKSRKSLPAPALISADFYSSSAKKAKRNTMDVVTNGSDKEKAEKEPTKPATKEELGNLVTNPAALALAKKNKRLSQGLSPAASKQEKRASLPGILPLERELDTPLKKKSGKGKEESVEEKNDEDNEDSVEPMEEDEEEVETETQPSPKKPIVAKKKPKDLSEFDIEAILSRCNEIVRTDREKRKEGATLRQKKKDEKRRQREQEKQEEAAEGEADESMEQQKKKKKKKKPVNYLLEELGETKEDQVARALQRKMAQLEAKRERKKAKKAAKLRQQLNKENQQEDKATGGIAAKLEKKAKKAKKAEKEEAMKIVLKEPPVPVVKRAISAFAMYSEQIDELKKTKAEKKKTKSKQLKEKNQHRAASTAVEEVQAALQVNPKKDKSSKQKHVSTEESSSTEVLPSPEVHSKTSKKKDISDTVAEESVPVKQKKKDKPAASKSDDSAPKKKKLEQVNSAPLKSVLSLDDELAQLKKSLSDPVAKVVKKQKLSHKESSIATITTSQEVTPPRKTTTAKLKALTRLEAGGFHEEPVTPDHKLLKRNHGFKEEPVTPKSIGFKVSSVLPAGQEALEQEATEAKKKKAYHNTNRIRPEDVREPAKGLPLPIWTRSGTFEVEELSSEGKSKKAYKGGSSDYVPLSVNGGATEFLVKPLGGGKRDVKASGGVAKVHRVDVATVDDAVINFKKQAIFGKNAHLREKKSKH